MDNVKIKNEEDKKIKKDFHPLWIYLVFQLVVPIILIIIIGAIGSAITGNEGDSQQITNVAAIISMYGLFFTFLIMYFSKIKTEIKRLTKKQIIFTLIVIIIDLVLNIIMTSTMKSLDVTMNNQDTISNLLSTYATASIIFTTIIAPFTEEIVFRYSLGTLIKNNALFVIISSLLFAVFHGIGIISLVYI